VPNKEEAKEMEIHVKRTREPTKGLLSRKNWKLSSTITVGLSEADKALIGRYDDPSVSAKCVNAPYHIRFHYNGTDDSYKQIDVEEDDSRLSSFRLTASLKGHEHMESIQQFEEATRQALESAMSHLRDLDSWVGEKVLASR